MQNLSLKATSKTPMVHFIENQSTLFIGGRSLPEHPFNFYEEIFVWLKSYFAKNETANVKIEIMFEYCNTDSSKVILDFFSRIKSILPSTGSCFLKWFYEADDPDMKDVADLIFAENLLPGEVIRVEKLVFPENYH